MNFSMNTTSNWLKNTVFSIKNLLNEERRINIQILELLWEIERRKAFCELGYDGLYSFCVKELKLTESQAFQRIQAMHALKSVPELKEKIESGSMSITTVAQVQVFLRQEQLHGNPRSNNEKKELFSHFENKPSKQVKKELLELKGKRVKTLLTLELDEETENLWTQFKSETTHSTQGDSLNSFKLLLNNWYQNKEKQNDNQHQSKIKSKSPLNAKNKTSTPIPTEMECDSLINTSSNPQPPTPNNINLQRTSSGSTQVSRYIPAANRRTILNNNLKSQEVKQSIKANSLANQNASHPKPFRCENCNSIHAIQIDHQKPLAKGGTHQIENLRILCRNCNLYEGIRHYGLEAMQRQAPIFS